MNEAAWQLVIAVGAVFGALAAVGLYADHQRRKYHALAEAERDAERRSAAP